MFLRFIAFGAMLALSVTLGACGRDGYVVVKEAKTPHRAFDVPSVGDGKREEESYVPLPIVPIEKPGMVPVPELKPNLLPLVPARAAKPSGGTAVVSVAYGDPTGDRISKFPEGSVKDCAIFRTAGDGPAQRVLLYTDMVADGRTLRFGLDLALVAGATPAFDLSRLAEPLSLATFTLRPVIGGRSFVDATDTNVDAEAPPMWGMAMALRADKLDRSCRADANIDRKGKSPRIAMSLECGAIAGDASVESVRSLYVAASCDARETLRVPYFPAAEKKAGGK